MTISRWRALRSKKKRANGMRSSERTIKRLGEIIAGDEAVSEDPGRLIITDLATTQLAYIPEAGLDPNDGQLQSWCCSVQKRPEMD